MKTLTALLALVLGATLPIAAQEPADDAEVQPIPQLLTAEQLDTLLGPIALYPDALIAIILPASTHPADIVLAARYLKESPGDLSQVEHRAWDDSIKSLIHYPDVLRWMDENLTWTKQLGEAFALQPADVMNAVQRLRAKAQTNGALANTPQQQVLSEANVIRIVPADPEVIYVPRYDPAVVYVERPYLYPNYYTPLPPLLTFGVGWRVGSWLAYDFDWHRCTLWVGDRHRRWSGRHDWHKPVVPIAPVAPAFAHTHRTISRPWQPPAHFHRPGLSPAHRTYRPRNDEPLARTYGRTTTPVHPETQVTPHRVQPVRPPPPAGATAPWLYRPPTHVNTTTRTTAVARPPASPVDSTGSHRHSGDWRRESGRTRPDGPSNDSAGARPAVTIVPPLHTVGPISAVRPTVVAPPVQRVAPAPSSRAHVAPAPYSHSRPAASPPAHRTFSPRATTAAPAPAAPVQASPQVQPPASAPASVPSTSTPAPAHRGGSRDVSSRHHLRAEP